MATNGLPEATLISAGEGRTRLRVASRRDDPLYFASVTAGLSAIRGVRDVKATPLSGSVLIWHDAPFSTIGAEAEEKGLFSLVEGPAAAAAPAAPPLRINARTAAAAGLGLIALWQMHQKKYFPSALSVAMHAVALSGLFQMDDASDD